MREAHLSVSDMIWPLFVREGSGIEEPIASMPGVSRLSIDKLVERAWAAEGAGIPAVAVFPVIDPALKTLDGELATDPENLVCRAVSSSPDRCIWSERPALCSAAIRSAGVRSAHHQPLQSNDGRRLERDLCCPSDRTSNNLLGHPEYGDFVVQF